MKKKNLFICLISILILCVMITPKIPNNVLTVSAMIEPVQVEDGNTETQSHYKLKLNFDKEMEFNADYVTIRYNLTTKCDTISGCLNNIKSQTNIIKEELNEIDDKIEIETQYYSCYPELDNGATNQKCNYELKIKTGKIDRISEIIEKCDDLKINSYYGVEYKLNDENYAKSVAIKQAILEVKEHAKNINEDLTLVRVKEGYSYAYSENEKVIVKINITCEFN